MSMKIIILLALLNAVMCHFNSPALNGTDVDISAVIQHYADVCGARALCDPDSFMNPHLPRIDPRYCRQCPPCYCDKWCMTFDDCCVDLKLSRSSASHRLEVRNDIVCTKSVNINDKLLPTPKIAEIMYPVVYGCPDRLPDGDIVRKCDNVTDDFLSRIPVMSNSTGISFRNIYCFQCNNATNPVFWDMMVSYCDTLDHIVIAKSLNDLFSVARNSCDIEFVLNSNAAKSRVCNKMEHIPCRYNVSDDIEWACDNLNFPATITSAVGNPFCYYCSNPGPQSGPSTCNVTFMWKRYDNNLLNGCEKGPFINGTYGNFKNWYCYLCNSENNEDQKCDISQIFFPVTFFGHIFDLSSIVGDIVVDEVPKYAQCESNSIYDPYKSVCRHQYCPLGKVFWEEKCQLMLKRTYLYMAYTLYFRLNQLGNTTVVPCGILQEHLRKSIFAKLLDEVKASVDGDSNELKFILFVAVRVPQDSFLDGNVTGVNDIASLLHSQQSSIMVFIELLVKFTSDQNAVEETLLDARRFIYRIDIVSNQSYSFQAYPDDRASVIPNIGSQNNDCYTQTKIRSYVSSIADSRQVNNLLVCKQIELTTDEYQYRTGPNQVVYVYLPRLLVEFSRSQYTAIQDNVRICVSDYLDPYRNIAHKTITPFYIIHYLTLVSLIGSSLSLFSLLIAFITYCLFSQLRTLPGRLNMCLVVSLFFAIASFELVYYYQLSGVTCQVMGMALHYFWLSIFFCMNACCIHMYRVFSRQVIIRNGEGFRLKHYILYCFLFPLVIVALNLIVNTSLYGISSFGYQGLVCFLKPIYPLLFAYILPTSLLLCLNIVLFIITLRNISNTPRLPSNSGVEYRNHFLALLKLFTLTGITWILQFFDTLLEYTKVELSIFSLIVTLLSASQGLFLFFAFICNKRVLQAYKDCVACDRRATTNLSGINNAVHMYASRASGNPMQPVQHVSQF